MKIFLPTQQLFVVKIFAYVVVVVAINSITHDFMLLNMDINKSITVIYVERYKLVSACYTCLL